MSHAAVFHSAVICNSASLDLQRQYYLYLADSSIQINVLTHIVPDLVDLVERGLHVRQVNGLVPG